ncbi:uncharacterized protein LOC123440628 [Hordeum vulgare subsp. vulgare]|uniref:DUF674 domain-containing protein n=1 Tax=Hordeum vulgare subsp. vulgare TaxID=112509 RepID=A0A8I6X570_HORVV|nr:uncharacterized protein LOC123440628 [Hordeum vulgare subsp. vulgare]
MATTTRGGGTSPAMSMKLLVDTKAGCVLFAEPGKDVVDFLFSLLALPVGTAVSLLGKRSMVGSAGHLYASVQRLDEAYVLPGADIDALLRPAVPSPAAASNVSLLCLPGPSSSAASKRFFWCGEDHSRSYAYRYGRPERNYVTDASGGACPACGKPMTKEMYWARSDSGGGSGSGTAATGTAKGFVQGVVTYTVLDNLTVTPMSAISSITLLNTFRVRDLSALQEKIVRIGYKEGLAILKASLQSKTVLTDVFLAHKAPRSAA